MGFDDLVIVGHWFIMITGIVGLVIGFLLIFAKGAVERLGKVFNTSISFGGSAKFFDSPLGSMDSWVMARSKLAGVIYMLLSLGLIVAVARF